MRQLVPRPPFLSRNERNVPAHSRFPRLSISLFGESIPRYQDLIPRWCDYLQCRKQSTDRQPQRKYASTVSQCMQRVWNLPELYANSSNKIPCVLRKYINISVIVVVLIDEKQIHSSSRLPGADQNSASRKQNSKNFERKNRTGKKKNWQKWTDLASIEVLHSVKMHSPVSQRSVILYSLLGDAITPDRENEILRSAESLKWIMIPSIINTFRTSCTLN